MLPAGGGLLDDHLRVKHNVSDEHGEASIQLHVVHPRRTHKQVATVTREEEEEEEEEETGTSETRGEGLHL